MNKIWLLKQIPSLRNFKSHFVDDRWACNSLAGWPLPAVGDGSAAVHSPGLRPYTKSEPSSQQRDTKKWILLMKKRFGGPSADAVNSFNSSNRADEDHVRNNDIKTCWKESEPVWSHLPNQNHHSPFCNQKGFPHFHKNEAIPSNFQ